MGVQTIEVQPKRVRKKILYTKRLYKNMDRLKRLGKHIFDVCMDLLVALAFDARRNKNATKKNNRGRRRPAYYTYSTLFLDHAPYKED